MGAVYAQLSVKETCPDRTLGAREDPGSGDGACPALRGADTIVARGSCG